MVTIGYAPFLRSCKDPFRTATFPTSRSSGQGCRKILKPSGRISAVGDSGVTHSFLSKHFRRPPFCCLIYR